MKGSTMKTEITRETVLAIATKLAIVESNRVQAQRAGVEYCERYWGDNGYSLKEACNIFLGTWPVVYLVANVERPYIVVSFECLDADSEFYFDADTFELIK